MFNSHYPPWWTLTAADKQIKKIARIYNRFITGHTMDGQYRMVTLTTPESFDGDLYNAWEKFIRRMHRRNLFRGYFAVKEFNKLGTCIHIHCVVRLSYIDYQLALHHWRELTGSHWIHVDKVWDTNGMCRYLVKYITKQLIAKKWKHCYWYSRDWIHNCYTKFGKAILKYGSFPDIEETKLIHSYETKEKQKEYMNKRLIVEFMYSNPKPKILYIV